MRKIWQAAAPAIILAGGIWIGMRPADGKVEYAKAEKKSCTFCHVTQGKKDLNEAGNYYKDHNHSLEGYQPKK